MSNVIDDRVVSMKFDNSEFSKNVEASIQSLERLNKTIENMSGANAFEGLSKASSKLDLSGVSNAVDTIASKFTTLGHMGMTALDNITNKAVDAGTRIVKSLTIEPISTGFDEYELKMGSVQTIMNGANVSLEKTMETLEELNKYADETIYSFSDMTNNIGKFVNAGVDLDTAVNAIKGISNEAAVSGASAAEASRAMYNIAQAVGTGSMKLIDWKSIENANMATMAFKQTLIDTGKELGTIQKGATSSIAEADLTATNFRESISGVKGETWVTTEVMMKALAKYSDKTTEFGKKAYAAAQDVKTFSMLMDTLKEAAQSGWSESSENIFGNFEQAKEMWTAVSNEIGGLLDAQAKERNALLKAWNQGGGRDALLNSIANVWMTAKSIMTEAKKAFETIIPKTTSDQLINLSKSFESITKNIRDFVNTSDILPSVNRIIGGITYGLKNIGKAISNLWQTAKVIFGLVKDAFEEMFPSDLFSKADQLVKPIENISFKIISLTKSLYDFITEQKNLNNIKDIFKGIFSFVSLVSKAVTGLVRGIAKLLSPAKSILSVVASFILDLTAKFARLFGTLDKGADSIHSFKDLMTAVKKFVVVLKNSIGYLFSTSKDSESTFKNVLQNTKMFTDETINTITDFLNKIKAKFSNFKSSFSKKGGDIGETFKNNLSALFEKLGGNFSDNKDKLTNFVDSAKNAFVQLKETLSKVFDKIKASFQKIFGETKKLNLDGFVNVLKKVGTALVNVFVSGLNLITSAFNGFSVAFENSPIFTMNSILKGGIFTSITKLINIFSKKVADDGISKSIVSFIDSLKKNGSSHPISELTKSFTQLTESLKGFENKTKSELLREVAISIGILAASLVALSMVDTDKLGWALGALTAIMIELVGAFEILNKTGEKSSGIMSIFDAIGGNKVSKTTTTLIKFAIAVGILGSALAKIAGNDTTSIGASLAAISVLMWEMVAISKFLGKNVDKKMGSAANYLLLFAYSVSMMTKPLKDLCKYSWDQMLVGVIGFSAVVWEMVGVSKKLNSVKFGDTSGFLSLGIAVKLLGDALVDIGSLSWDQLAIGLLGMTACVGEILIASKILDESGITLSAAAGFIAMAFAVKMLGDALSTFGNLTGEQLTQGFVALISIMAGLLIFAKLLPETLIADSAGLIVMALAVGILTKSITKLGAMDFKDLLVGLAGVAGGILILVAACHMAESAIAGAAAMAIVAVGLIALAAALKIIGSMSLEQVATALVGLGLSLTLLALGLYAMEGALPGAAALIVASIGLLALAGAMMMLGSMSLEQICTGLIGMAGALAILGAASALLGPLIVPMIGLAAAMLLLGVGVVAIGGGLYMLAEALALIGSSGAMGVNVLILMCETFAAHLTALLKTVALFYAFDTALLLFGAACLVAGAGIAVLGAGLIVLSVGMLAVTGAAIVMVKGFQLIKEQLPELGKALSETLKKFKEAGKNIVNGIIEGIKGSVNKAVTAVKKLGTTIAEGFKKVLGIHSPSKAFEGYGLNIGEGLVNGLNLSEGMVGDAAFDLGSICESNFTDGLGTLADGEFEISPKLFTDTKEWDPTSALNLDNLDINNLIGDSDLTNLESLGDVDLSQFGDLQNMDFSNVSDLSKDMENISTTDFGNLGDLNTNIKEVSETTKKATISASELEEKAKEVIAGKYGNGADRVKALGDQYAVIQNKVNEMLGSSVRHETNIEVVADTSSLDEANKKVEEFSTNIKKTGYEARKEILDQTSGVPISVKNAVRDAMSAQERLLYNYGDKIPSSARHAIESVVGITDASTEGIKKTTEETKKSIQECNDTIDEINTKDISPTVSSSVSEELQKATSTSNQSVEVEVTPTFNLSNINTEEIKTKLSQAMTEAASNMPIEVNTKLDFTNLKNQFVAFFGNVIGTIKSSTSDFSEKLTDAFREIVFDTTGDLEDMAHENFRDCGIEFAEGVANGVLDSYSNGNKLTEAFQVLLFDTLTDLEEFAHENFEDIGREFVEGIAYGINSSYKLVRDAAVKLAKLAVSAMKKELDINSPSKVTEELGMYSDMGLAKGLDKYSSLVDKSATNVGSNVKDALNDTLANLNLDDINTEPVIRPVLDLSDIEDKASQLNSLMSQNQAASISANYSYSNQEEAARNAAMMNQMSQMNNKLADMLNMMSTQEPTPIDVSVELQGDAKGLFNMVKKQGQLYTRTTGKYAF